MVAYPKNKFSFAFFCSISVFVLLDFSSVTRFILAVTETEVQAICSSTLIPSFCSKFLKSDPKIEKLDLSGAAKYLINHAQGNALDTKKSVTITC